MSSDNQLSQYSRMPLLTAQQYAMTKGAWQISTCLLDYGAEHDKFFHYRSLKIANAEARTYFESFLMRDELSDTARIVCLAYISEDLDHFTDLVSRFWPDNEFYDAALEDQRFDSGILMLKYFRRAFHSPSPPIFEHLFSSLSLPEATCSTTTKVLSYLALGIGILVWHDPEFVSTWQSAFFGIALRLNKAFMLPAPQPSGTVSFDYGWLGFPSEPTLFTNLFLPSLRALPGFSPHRARQHKVKGRLANCEKAAHMWLNMLRDCGVDLIEYGRQEKQRLDDQQYGRDFLIFRDVWWDERDETDNGWFEVRLISFKYGSQPADWELWWSEPTDELVGDFWREVEPEEWTLNIPGSWVEDQDFELSYGTRVWSIRMFNRT